MRQRLRASDLASPGRLDELELVVTDARSSLQRGEPRTMLFEAPQWEQGGVENTKKMAGGRPRRAGNMASETRRVASSWRLGT